VKVETCPNFGGRCEKAVDFYRQAIGARAEMLVRNSPSRRRA